MVCRPSPPGHQTAASLPTRRTRPATSTSGCSRSPAAGAVQVTTDPATDWQPAWSPDGNTPGVSIGARWRWHLRRSRARRARAPADDVWLLASSGLRTDPNSCSWSGRWPRTRRSLIPPVYLVGLDGAPPKRILADVLAKFRCVGPIALASRRRADLVPRPRTADSRAAGFWTVPLAGGAPVRAEGLGRGARAT